MGCLCRDGAAVVVTFVEILCAVSMSVMCHTCLGYLRYEALLGRLWQIVADKLPWPGLR